MIKDKILEYLPILYCFLYGHNYQKVVYADAKYDAWICTRCGNVLKKRRY